MRKSRSSLVWIVIMMLLLAGTASNAETRVESEVSVGPDGVQIRMSVGAFVVESGASMAVEIVRDEASDCLREPVLVTAFMLLRGESTELCREAYDEPIDVAEWLGRVSLTDSESGEPLSEGAYIVRVETSVGVFSAVVEVVATSAMAGVGSFSVHASVCGLELRVYRLIRQEDDGVQIALRKGDRLMVALAGNATTGFQWENAILYEYAVLRETEDTEYRAKPQPQEMVGYGGEFLFRYEAIDVGPQAFRFIYHRPWESVEASEVVEFTAIVY